MKNSVVYLLLGYVLFSSCGDVKKLQYLQGPIDTSKYGTVNYKEPVIQNGDILSITVYSANPVASAIYNQAPTATVIPSAGTGNAPSLQTPGNVAGYLVDNQGNIQFHSIGNIQAKGLTRQELGATITKKLDTVLTNPYCQVRFTNFKITIIGEVTHPSVFTVPSEKVSVLEAIGLAGDLTVTGRRDSVMIIRETDKERKFGWIDLRKPDLFESEYFYLQQNDVVVVHPTKSKAAANDQVVIRNIGLASTVVSTLAILYSIIFR
jgi:polysaccharide biosynthesis/export protein